MTTDRQNRAQAALFARFGVPRQLPPDEVDADGMSVVRVYACGSREAAEAFAACDRELWGNRARAELRESVGWVVVVDLRRHTEVYRGDHPLPRSWA